MDHNFSIAEIAFIVSLIGSIMSGEAIILWQGFKLYKRITKSFSSMEYEREMEHKSLDIFKLAELATKLKILKDNLDNVANISRTVTTDILERVTSLESKVQSLIEQYGRDEKFKRK